MAPRTERSGPRGVGPDPHKTDTGASGTTVVSLSVAHPGDVSPELGSLADLMRKPGTLAEPREGD